MGDCWIPVVETGNTILQQSYKWMLASLIVWQFHWEKTFLHSGCSNSNAAAYDDGIEVSTKLCGNTIHHLDS